MSGYYPIFLDLHERRVVIVGGGNVSARKAEALMRCGARVHVVAPECVSEIDDWARNQMLTLARKPYDASDLENATLVIAATSSSSTNAQIAHDCRERRIFVNVADDSALCDFIVPAIIESGAIQIAISSGGKSPALARLVKHDLQEFLGDEYAEVNEILGSLREAAKESPKLPTDADRKRFFDDLLALGILDLLREGNRVEAYRAIADACAASGVVVSDLVRAGLRA